MPSIVIELTNHCNLNCRHCNDKRHGAGGYLQLDIIYKVLQNARTYGFDYISFTGGEPTMHPEFTDILDMVNNAEYKYGFVTNGWNFSSIYEQLDSRCSWLSGITFSLDGANHETHDRIRGKGSFNKLMSAVSICVARDIPFTFNTLITKNNCYEIKDIADFTTELGGGGLRFGHLILTPSAVENELDLSPDERKDIDAAGIQIGQGCSMPVYIAPGHYTSDLFPCDPLKGREMNIDWKGNVTMCCHISGFGENITDRDVIGSLDKMSFPEAYKCSLSLNREFHKEKIRYFNEYNVLETDFFPCWYCMNFFRKINWLKAFPQNPWHGSIWTDKIKRTEISDDKVKSESKT